MPARISVVTATLNRRELLRRAIQSVVAQGLLDVEHIVVDGASSDGTLEMLTEFPHLRVYSERDSGLYEAWNKGVARATGDLVCFLNDDDEIPQGAFDEARAAIVRQPNLELLSGPVELCWDRGDGTRTTRLINDARILSLREQDIGPGVPITNGRYFTPRLLRRVGAFDERYKLVSDRVFLLEALLSSPVHATTQKALYRYYTHADSLTMSNIDQEQRISIECLRAARNGFAEATAPAVRRAYGRWQAWATLYLVSQHVRHGQLMAAATLGVSAFRCDFVWVSRTAPFLWRHMLERTARQGYSIDG